LNAEEKVTALVGKLDPRRLENEIQAILKSNILTTLGCSLNTMAML